MAQRTHLPPIQFGGWFWCSPNNHPQSQHQDRSTENMTNPGYEEDTETVDGVSEGLIQVQSLHDANNSPPHERSFPVGGATLLWKKCWLVLLNEAT